MDREDLISMFKATAWERAKGALREVSAAAGQSRSIDKRHVNYDEIDGRIEQFIKGFEDDGLAE